MPTGYTAAVQDGEITEFRDFAMRCARAMGACVMMRDDPMDAEIPDEFEPHTSYHDDKITAARELLLRVEGMTDAECYAEARKEREQWQTAFDERQRKRDLTRERYTAMLDEARAWEPPTPDHKGLRDFMIQQLSESIDFDCNGDYDKPGPFLDGQGWRREAVRKARRDIEYHTAEREKEVDRARSRSKWIQDLRRSLTSIGGGQQ